MVQMSARSICVVVFLLKNKKKCDPLVFVFEILFYLFCSYLSSYYCGQTHKKLQTHFVIHVLFCCACCVAKAWIVLEYISSFCLLQHIGGLLFDICSVHFFVQHGGYCLNEVQEQERTQIVALYYTNHCSFYFYLFIFNCRRYFTKVWSCCSAFLSVKVASTLCESVCND